MPAGRIGGDVRWDDGTYSAGLGVLHTFAQGAVPENELSTDSYGLLNVTLGYSRSSGGLVHSLVLRGERRVLERHHLRHRRASYGGPEPSVTLRVDWRPGWVTRTT